MKPDHEKPVVKIVAQRSSMRIDEDYSKLLRIVCGLV
jgi:hypothetical protein